MFNSIKKYISMLSINQMERKFCKSKFLQLIIEKSRKLRLCYTFYLRYVYSERVLKSTVKY